MQIKVMWENPSEFESRNCSLENVIYVDNMLRIYENDAAIIRPDVFTRISTKINKQ